MGDEACWVGEEHVYGEYVRIGIVDIVKVEEAHKQTQRNFLCEAERPD